MGELRLWSLAELALLVEKHSLPCAGTSTHRPRPIPWHLDVQLLRELAVCLRYGALCAVLSSAALLERRLPRYQDVLRRRGLATFIVRGLRIRVRRAGQLSGARCIDNISGYRRGMRVDQGEWFGGHVGPADQPSVPSQQLARLQPHADRCEFRAHTQLTMQQHACTGHKGSEATRRHARGTTHLITMGFGSHMTSHYIMMLLIYLLIVNIGYLHTCAHHANEELDTAPPGCRPRDRTIRAPPYFDAAPRSPERPRSVTLPPSARLSAHRPTQTAPARTCVHRTGRHFAFTLRARALTMQASSLPPERLWRGAHR
jgi:hypothetical protein